MENKETSSVLSEITFDKDNTENNLRRTLSEIRTHPITIPIQLDTYKLANDLSQEMNRIQAEISNVEVNFSLNTSDISSITLIEESINNINASLQQQIQLQDTLIQKQQEIFKGFSDFSTSNAKRTEKEIPNLVNPTEVTSGFISGVGTNLTSDLLSGTNEGRDKMLFRLNMPSPHIVW